MSVEIPLHTHLSALPPNAKGYCGHRGLLPLTHVPPHTTEPVTKGVDLEVGEVQILIEIEEARDKTGQNSKGRGRETINPSMSRLSSNVTHRH